MEKLKIIRISVKGQITKLQTTLKEVSEISPNEHKKAKIQQNNKISPVNEIDNFDHDPEETQCYDINLITTGHSGKFMIDIKVENKDLKMELDTGAALSSISLRQFRSLGINK
ncbi:hypothetical protein ACJJTC_010049 [Scirpophaga incertulas]